ncbi:family taurine catabolism dioxygenase [Lecanosticta acicola]|uniref:Family taurine catabolism dioxygenase n=1 Tax=Lecanosticta acicola TaxID=111012 RepID=A0AAI9E8B5_9PEZI|nr:family taurine catabolism dioxygenase [Lecanosticta acicola]
MAPIAQQVEDASTEHGSRAGNRQSTNPLKPTGALDQYPHIELTPVIGREYPTASLVEWLQAPNADELLQELAYTISSRGVVFFRAQNLTNDLQKDLIHRLGQLSGKPSTSTLHIHPVLNSEGSIDEQRDPDQQISTISSKLFKKVYGLAEQPGVSPKKQSSDQWHSDIAFEPVPADYSSLRLTQLPETGGDTLWASGYEIYDRISEPVQAFLKTLSCTFSRPDFLAAAERGNFQIYDKPRGSPLNTGSSLEAVHPVVRTNPVTGWASIYPVGQHAQYINDLTAEESQMFLTWFKTLLKENHDLQVRFRWQNENDIAIWDNRCTFHTATFDFDGLGDRAGNRAVGIGEKPYFDPASKGRREALADEGREGGRYFKVG